MSHSAAFALHLGIDYVGQPSQLGGCRNDVSNMIEYLDGEAKLRFEKRWVGAETRIAGDDGAERFQPTSAGIRQAMAELMAAVKVSPAKWKYVLFQVSSHGSQIRDTSGDEVDGLDEVIVPLDYAAGGKMISDDELCAWIKELPAEIWVCADLCRSGTLFDLAEAGDAFRGFQLSSCKDSQTAADAIIENTGQGAGTACLLKALRESRSGDYNDIIRIVYDGILGGGYTQRPRAYARGTMKLFDCWPTK